MKKINNFMNYRLHWVLLALCALVLGGNAASNRETKKTGAAAVAAPQNPNDGVAVYTNELYSPAMPRMKQRNSSGTDPSSSTGDDEEDEPVYDDYNADYDIPATFTNYRNKQISSQFEETREIVVKQGRIKGAVRVMHPQSGLHNVDQFLGIPYAEAPVGSRRFMPPSAPVPWPGVKLATKFASVCPQRLPDINNPENTMSKGRYDQLKRLLPYLKNESEDCLYLNLYVPSSGECDTSFVHLKKQPFLV